MFDATCRLTLVCHSDNPPPFESYYTYLHFYYNNNMYLLQLGCHVVAVVILHVYRI